VVGIFKNISGCVLKLILISDIVIGDFRFSDIIQKLISGKTVLISFPLGLTGVAIAVRKNNYILHCYVIAIRNLMK